MPKIDIASVPVFQGSIYPGKLNDIVAKRTRQALGNAGGLTQFGVNLTCLPPGAASAHRHWHEMEDEFFYIVKGEGILIEDDGEVILGAGDAATFKAGVKTGHHIVNCSDEDLIVLEVGTRAMEENVTYTDESVDMKVSKSRGQWKVSHKNGDPY